MQTVHRRFVRIRLLVWMALILVALLPQCVSFRMSDQKVQQYFANAPIKPSFGFVGDGKQRVHVASIGADSLPVALFIHGSPGSWDAFIQFFTDSLLYRQLRLVSVDRPGFGKSNYGHTEPSLAVQAAAIAPLLHLNHAGHKPILIGHSLGGPVAVRLAMDYPDAIGGLILVAPSVDPALEKQEWYRPIGNAIPIRWWLPTELRVSNQEILPLKGQLQAMLPLWAKIRVPITVIQGTADELVPAGNADFVKRMAPQTKLMMVPGMNHFIPWRRPDLIRTALIHHLTTEPGTN